jgi:hypothetical protein
MSKQTAVEWLAEQMQHPELHNPYIEQALAMEREQIEDAYRINPNNEIWSNSGIDYYNETYKGGEQ